MNHNLTIYTKAHSQLAKSKNGHKVNSSTKRVAKLFAEETSDRYIAGQKTRDPREKKRYDTNFLLNSQLSLEWAQVTEPISKPKLL